MQKFTVFAQKGLAVLSRCFYASKKYRNHSFCTPLDIILNKMHSRSQLPGLRNTTTILNHINKTGFEALKTWNPQKKVFHSTEFDELWLFMMSFLTFKGPPTPSDSVSVSESPRGTNSKQYCSSSGLNGTGNPSKRCYKRYCSLSRSRLVWIDPKT